MWKAFWREFFFFLRLKKIVFELSYKVGNKIFVCFVFQLPKREGHEEKYRKIRNSKCADNHLKGWGGGGRYICLGIPILLDASLDLIYQTCAVAMKFVWSLTIAHWWNMFQRSLVWSNFLLDSCWLENKRYTAQLHVMLHGKPMENH